MFLRLCVVSAFLLVVTLAAELPATRPKNCTPGTQYKKSCNTCTCDANEKKDKCSLIDCNRNTRTRSSTTKRPPSTARPGVCPTIATPPPGNNDCAKRTQTDQCKLDKDCPAAKRCCKNGCGTFLCRNAIYKNSP